MARDYKPVELRPVDDDAVSPARVVRLNNRETARLEKDNKPIRLGPLDADSGISQRLDLPSRDDTELRTHQPGIESIIETDVAPQEQLEENWAGESIHRNPTPWGWFALVGLTIAAAIVWSLARVGKAEVHAGQIRSATASTVIQDEQEELEARQLIDRINQSLKDFFKASSVDALVPLIRQSDRVAPFMRRYYGDHPLIAMRLKSVTSLEPLTLDDYANFWTASVVMADRSTRIVIIEITDSGKPLIDWETLVCYQPMNWDDFIAQRPTGSSLDLRVYVEPDNYYNYEFGNFKRWTCFRLTAFGSEENLYGYTLAGSALTQDIQLQIDHNGGTKAAMILRLRRAPGQQSPNGVTIEKLVSPRWLQILPPNAGQ